MVKKLQQQMVFSSHLHDLCLCESLPEVVSSASAFSLFWRGRRISHVHHNPGGGGAAQSVAKEVVAADRDLQEGRLAGIWKRRSLNLVFPAKYNSCLYTYHSRWLLSWRGRGLPCDGGLHVLLVRRRRAAATRQRRQQRRVGAQPGAQALAQRRQLPTHPPVRGPAQGVGPGVPLLPGVGGQVLAEAVAKVLEMPMRNIEKGPYFRQKINPPV